MGAATSEAAPDYRWIEAVQSRLEYVLGLDDDWDSYGSPPPTPAAVSLAAGLLNDIAGLDVPVPSIRGTAEGGVTIEWYTPTVEFIVEVEASGNEAEAFFRDRTSGHSSEGPLTHQSDVVLKALHRLQLGF